MPRIRLIPPITSMSMPLIIPGRAHCQPAGINTQQQCNFLRSRLLAEI
ncbi:hypothetical protein C4K00_2052 [Pseudomonas synxantha]|nr:hypothetical protein C4K00_2052 [Pseudomonas synxantha]